MDIFKVIKCDGKDCGNDVFVWKFPGEDFNTLSQLIVHESQEAIFFKDGQALDTFGPGRYTLHSQNIPLIRRLVNLPFNGESPFHCEVYFINKTVSMNIRWGTPTPLQIEDAKYRIMIPVRMFGQFAIQVAESKKLLIKLVGTTREFNQKTLSDCFKGILLTNIRDYVAKMFVQKEISILEIQSYLKEISNSIADDLRAEFTEYGLELVDKDGNTVKQGEVGELCVKGPGVMRCYYNDKKATDEVLKDGWLLTGDVAKEDEDGFIYLVDRAKDVIISGGENLYPVQIEDFLRKHDAIKDVAVIGLPDTRLGEIAAAIIELKPDHVCTEAEIEDFCKELPRYKRPHKFIFADVPRNPTGKIEKPKLREIYCGESVVAKQIEN